MELLLQFITSKFPNIKFFWTGLMPKKSGFLKTFCIYASIKRNLRLKWSGKYYQVLLASSTKFHFI